MVSGRNVGQRRKDSRYKNLIPKITNEAALTIALADYIRADLISIKREVRQEDTIYPKLFTLTLEDTF